MARRSLLTDEEILARARPVFVEKGYAARTKQLAAAVGLTWGAIAARFGSKQALFTQAMDGPVDGSPQGACEAPLNDSLPGLLTGLRASLWERWPRRLQLRLAAAAGSDDEADRQRERLAAALESLARRGSIRSDLSGAALASMLLTLLTGDVAQRFVECDDRPAPDPALIDSIVRLLSAA